jgi:hypothetical protein
MTLTPEIAGSFARMTLGHVRREYPNHPGHLLLGETDETRPSRLHPAFFGSYDWHSCVHGVWQLARILRLTPGIAEADRIVAMLSEVLTAENIAGELAYFRRPGAAWFERPYGHAWLLKLAAELIGHPEPRAAAWRAALEPLTRHIVTLAGHYLPRMTYPVRSGTHSNTAFALTLFGQYAGVAGDESFKHLIGETARRWYGADADCQAWEPSQDDFLSPALTEARCMQAVLSAEEFAAWLGRFLPGLGDRRPATLFSPASVYDRTDAKVVHLDGLNLSRAWCLVSLARDGLATGTRAVLAEAAELHLGAAISHVGGDYVGEHWLASFALLALTDRPG